MLQGQLMQQSVIALNTIWYVFLPKIVWVVLQSNKLIGIEELESLDVNTITLA